MPSELKRDNGSARCNEREARELSKAISILSKAIGKQQLPELGRENETTTKGSSAIKRRDSSSGSANYFHRELSALEQFGTKYQNERNFSKLTNAELFKEFFKCLLRNRLCSLEWNERVPVSNLTRALSCLRILVRDPAFQALFCKLGGLKPLSKKLAVVTESCLKIGEQDSAIDVLREMTNICQKLVADASQREAIMEVGLHKTLVLLLSCTNVVVLHSSLYALIGLAQSESCRNVIGELNCIEILMHIIQEYDVVSKQLALTLLRTLCPDPIVREQVKVFDGIPVLLSLVDSDNLKLLWNMVWTLVQLSEDADTSDEIRLLGGIPLLLSLLQERSYTTNRGSTVPKSADVGRAIVATSTEEAGLDQKMSLKSAVCAAVTELVLNNTNAQHIVQGNGVFLLGMMIFPRECTTPEESAALENLQKSAFRALRFLFSMERNRQLFKRLFPPLVFEKFIDVGHYKKDLEAYTGLVDMINNLPEDQRDEIKTRIEATNQNKAPTHYVSQYAVYEHLGTGAFGSVYKVKKTGGQTFLAMKEISIHSTALGKSKREKDQSVGDIINECAFVKEQLRHPNVVRYYKAFKQDDKLYIIMELIDGAPLGEHFNSLKEKGERFTEDRLWNIFIQMVLALRYIHKEKRIVHRDLTPNNIMLGENDKVTITDFGLARQKQPDASKLTSVVGTILYSCPEIIQNTPYGEKADIWALGCILYQMATLNPPFYSSNMLSLATRIVEADFDPLPEGVYSEKVAETISRCLTPSPDDRPDIHGVAAVISGIILMTVDKLRTVESQLEKKLEKERKRTHRQFVEAHHNMCNLQWLYQASQKGLESSLCLGSSYSRSKSSNTEELDSDDDMEEQYKKMFSLQKSSSSTVDGDEPERFVSRQNGSPTRNYPLSKSEGTESNGRNDSPIRRSSRNSSFTQDSLEIAASDPSGKTNSTKRSARRQLSIEDTQLKTGSQTSPGKLEGVEDFTRPQNFKRTQSSTTVEIQHRVGSGYTGRLRPTSATATLSISPRKVRQINDPILQILSLLHKIIYISQLPPSLSLNPQRRAIDQFKRSLFSARSNAVNLKNEMKKVLECSKELIDLSASFGYREPLLLKVPGLDSSVSEVGSDHGITYEHMQSMVENVLKECGYYDTSPNAGYRQAPLGPISSTPSSPST